MVKKTIPLPCSEEQYKIIKMFCLINNFKYADLTKILLQLIDEKEKGNNDNNV